jgi:hypothetical protein
MFSPELIVSCLQELNSRTDTCKIKLFILLLVVLCFVRRYILYYFLCIGLCCERSRLPMAEFGFMFLSIHSHHSTFLILTFLCQPSCMSLLVGAGYFKTENHILHITTVHFVYALFIDALFRCLTYTVKYMHLLAC